MPTVKLPVLHEEEQEAPVRVRRADTRSTDATTPLTEAQRELVARAIPLVMRHLKTRVCRRGRFLRPDEFAELFQSGCCGLIRAAQTYPVGCPVPFDAYALQRIRQSVHEALRDSDVIHLPRTRTLARGNCGPGTDPSRPRSGILKFEPLTRQRSDPDPDNVDNAIDGLATIGERLACRVHAAVKAAVRAERRRTHNTERKLLDRYVARRLSVIGDAERISLRALAGECGVSLAKVCVLEQRMHRAVRRILAADNEFQILRAGARRLPGGFHEPLDRPVLDKLRAAAAEDFWNRLRLRPPDIQQRILSRLVETAGGDVVRAVFAALPSEDADALLVETLAA